MHVPYSGTQIRKDFGTTLAPDGKFPLVNAEDMHFVFVPRFEFHVWACGTFVVVVRPHFPHVFVKEGIMVVFVAAANANELLLAPGSLPMFLVATLLEVNFPAVIALPRLVGMLFQFVLDQLPVVVENLIANRTHPVVTLVTGQVLFECEGT